VSQVVNAIESMVIRGTYTPEAKIIRPELVIRASSGGTAGDPMRSQMREEDEGLQPLAFD
jgi:hypothetical protein